MTIQKPYPSTQAPAPEVRFPMDIGKSRYSIVLYFQKGESSRQRMGPTMFSQIIKYYLTRNIFMHYYFVEICSIWNLQSVFVN